MGFNTTFNDTGEKPRFIHKANPLAEHAYQIFEFKQEKSGYEPVGDYILLDTEEDRSLTDVKVDTITRFLNGKKDAKDFSHLTKTQLLFQVVPRTDETSPTKMVFRTRDGQGVSKENALLSIEKGVLDE